MKIRTLLVAGVSFGLAAAVGCSKGSEHKFTPVGGAQAGTGALTSALPAPNRAPSYSFQSLQLNDLAGSGRVTALAAAPIGTDILASHAPGATVALLNNGTATDEQSVSFFKASSMASVGSNQAFLATSDADMTDAGQVFQRTGTTWSIALNPGRTEASVSAVGSEVYAFAGGENAAGLVYRFDGTTFTEVAAVNSTIPQRAATLAGSIYVGGMNNSTEGGGAQLFRLNSASLTEIALPLGVAIGNGLGVRQEITDMMTVTYGSVSGGGTGGGGAAVIGYDTHIAPLLQAQCSSCHAITGIVGTAMLFNDASAQSDYAVVSGLSNTTDPASSQFLLKASATVTHTGSASATWAVGSTEYNTVLQWMTEGAVATGSLGSGGTGSAVSGELVFIAVGAFARTGGQASSGALLAFNGADFEVMATYAMDAPTSLAWIDNTLYVGTAAGTLSYRDGNGALVPEANLPANTGVLSLLSRNTDTLAIGTRTSNGGTVFVRTPGAAPAPAPTPNPSPAPSSLSYATDIAPLLATSCSACHANQAIVSSFMLFTDTTAANDYATVLARVTAGNGAGSSLLLKASNQTTHTGGALWTPASTQYTTVAAWIDGGAGQ